MLKSLGPTEANKEPGTRNQAYGLQAGTRNNSRLLGFVIHPIMDIQILNPSDIDQLKWNSCVHYATHPSFSGYTWFLNAYSKDWIGLVEGEYETVMPLFVQRDWLGREVYNQPYHIAPTGPFSIHVMSRPRLLGFLKAMPARVKNALLPWEGQIGLAGFRHHQVERDLLHLYAGYSELEKAFTWKEGAPFLEWNMVQVQPERMVVFWKENTSWYRQRDQDYHRYLRIMYQAMHRGLGFMTGLGREPDRLEAAGFFIATGGVLYRLVSAALPGNDGLVANRAMIDLLIQTHAGRPLMLDLNKDPLAASFGATRLQYTLVSN